MRRIAPALVLVMVVAACGGGDGESIFGTGSTLDTGSTTTTVADGTGTTSATTTTAPTTTTTTTLAPDLQALEAIAIGDYPPADPPGSSIGTPDTATAAAITSDLVAAGVPVEGLDVWVLPVNGTGEKMLVFSTDASADQLAETDVDLFALLPTLPSLADADDITRFTLHYYDSDADGDFVLTTTMRLDVLFAYDGEELPEDEVALQLKRLP